MKKIIFFLLISYLVCFGQETGARYLIITHDNFYDAIMPLAQWKHKKGMRTKVVKLSEIGFTASQIKNYIIDAYSDWQIQPEFLLLVGAPNLLPFPQIGDVYTDNYYTNMDGDIYNEILSGRLTVHNITEAQTVVNKIITYERTPDITDPSWFKRACLIVRHNYDHDDSIYWSDVHYAASLLVSNNYVKIDTLSNLYGDDASSVIDAVDNGRSILMYRGTGTNNWYSPFDVNPDLTQNGPWLPIVLSLTCRTIGTSITPAVAEKWLLTGTPTIPRGASGYFATTTAVLDQAFLRSAVARGFFDAVFLQHKRTFAEACEVGRIRVYQMYPSQGGVDEYYGFTTLGDPEMNLWTASPKMLTVFYDSSLAVGGEELDVQVKHLSLPVESAFVCIVYDTILYETGYTDGNGNISFPMNLPHPGNLELTITGKNLFPFEAIIPVISDSAYLGYEHYTIDDALGNNNDIVNNGETILLWVTVKNFGAKPAHGVSATVRCNDTDVVMVDSLSYYGEILPQDSFSGLSPYVFSVSPTCPTHSVNFQLIAKDSNKKTWCTNFSIPITGVESNHGGEIGPDQYGYYIYDDTDTTTGNAPVYDWYEIASSAGGPGTIITQISSEDDDTVTISLPFTFKYYGINYNSIGICTNGFVEFGYSTSRSGSNTIIPNVGVPKRFVAPFWDNLNPGYQYSGHGDIYRYYDAVNHRWILEFYQVAHRNSGSQWETFQVILLDPYYYPTPTGDGQILCLYQTVTNGASNTVGIEDQTEIRGIQYVYNNSYDQHAAPLLSGRALLITTKPPAEIPAVPWLYLENCSISDSSQGNNNGIIEPGETVELTLTLKNRGDTLAANVLGTLHTTDSDGLIFDSSSNFADIAIDGISNNGDDPYVLQVHSNPIDSTIGLILSLKANSGAYATQDYFTTYLYIKLGIIDKLTQTYPYNSALTVYPNPFSHKISIKYYISPGNYPNQDFSLNVYDVCGRLIKNVLLPNNDRTDLGFFEWDATDNLGRSIGEGVYFVRLETGNSHVTEKLILVR